MQPFSSRFVIRYECNCKQLLYWLLENAQPHREIVESCMKGDRQAQFELYRLYSKAMYNVCLRMVNSVHDAEDVLQNAFIDIFGKIASFRFESTIGAWIKRIVINHCINFLKKKKLAFDELGDHLLQRPDTSDPAAEPLLSVEAIHRAVGLLPEGYRVVFSLYLLEGYDHEEISGILGISEQTSKSQYSRAKARLREILGEQGGMQVIRS